jgi:hypothetical protein
MPRPLTAALLAATAISTPYLASETELGQRVTSSISSVANTVSPPAAVSTGANDLSNAHHQTETLWDAGLGPRDLTKISQSSKPSQSIAGGPVHDLRDVLRFDISPSWVSQHFTRVSTVLADLRLDGLRVPLVTGTDPDDIAGTITYYFDHGGTLQRVNLHGFTGDPRRVIATMQQHFHMKPEPTLDAGVSVVRWNGAPTGLLKVTRAPVMYADATHQKYTVFLEINQPDAPYGMSAAAQQVVQADRYTGRW